MPARISSVFFTGKPSLPARSFMLSKALYSALGMEMLSRTILIFFSLAGFFSATDVLVALAFAFSATLGAAFFTDLTLVAAALTGAFGAAAVVAFVAGVFAAGAFPAGAGFATGAVALLATRFVFTAAAGAGADAVGATVEVVLTVAGVAGLAD